MNATFAAPESLGSHHIGIPTGAHRDRRRTGQGHGALTRTGT
jgi:hypothetical protein